MLNRYGPKLPAHGLLLMAPPKIAAFEHDELSNQQSAKGGPCGIDRPIQTTRSRDVLQIPRFPASPPSISKGHPLDSHAPLDPSPQPPSSIPANTPTHPLHPLPPH